MSNENFFISSFDQSWLNIYHAVMTQLAVTKIKNGRLTLPKQLRRKYNNARVIFVPAEDGIYIKPLAAPSLEAIEPKLKKLGKMVSDKLIDEAVAWARKKTYAGRT